MNGPQSWIASVVAAILGVMVVSVLVGPRLLHVAPRSATTQQTGSLPLGVCALSAEKLDLVESTRLEAKLVTYSSLESSDPDFPWRQFVPSPRPASWSRLTLPTPTPPPPYYWVVAGAGNYAIEIDPIHNGGKGGTASFHDSLGYVSADTCEGRGGKLDSHGWPAWFDKMLAVAEIKFK
jgi:hypothetical protein